MDNIITANNIFKCFRTGNNENFFALKNINIDIPRGKLTILKGRSGSGKTTLMNILSTLDEPSQIKPDGYEDVECGDVTLMGLKYDRLAEADKEMLRREQIGFVFQAVALIPVMNAYENVDFGMRLSGYGEKENGERVSRERTQELRDERIKRVLDYVGLKDRMLHLPCQMSGGEQQRVAIARAVASKPSVIFADEPTGALDTESGLKVMRLFGNLIEKEQVTIVMTTHDPSLMELGDMVFEMEDGEIIDRYSNN